MYVRQKYKAEVLTKNNILNYRDNITLTKYHKFKVTLDNLDADVMVKIINFYDSLLNNKVDNNENTEQIEIN